MSQSAQRTLRLLEYLAESGPTRLSTVAEDLGLNKSTAHRFLSTLVRSGYAQQDPETRAYLLTPKLAGLGLQVLDQIDLRQAVRPHLEELARRSGEAAHLAVLDALEIVYLDKVEGSQAVNMVSRVGGRARAHSTALGKVLMASRSREEWDRYVEEGRLTPRTERTITHPDRFRDELERVRGQGYAVDDVENEQGIRCVAAPIRDHSGAVMAAMSISGWTVSMTPERVEELIPVVVGQAAHASAALGHPADGTQPAPPGPEGSEADRRG